MNTRSTGWMLLTAAIFFWTSWALMPGVGVTDAAEILRLVSAQREQVLASSILQLASAALFALAIPGLVLRLHAFKERWAVALLAMGACGDAADAMYHQLAYEMTRPGVDQAAMLPVMQRMQSVDLLYLLPLVLAFLLGCVGLAVASMRSGLVTRWNPLLYLFIPLIVLAGRLSGVTSRVIGLTCLGILGLSLAWIGAALAHPRDVPTNSQPATPARRRTPSAAGTFHP